MEGVSSVSYNILIYYMPFARSQVLLSTLLYQNRCKSYANMHRKWILLPALWLAGFNSTILSPHYSRVAANQKNKYTIMYHLCMHLPLQRSPQLGHQTNIGKQRHFHPFIHIWSADVKSIKVHNVRMLRIQFSWRFNK